MIEGTFNLAAVANAERLVNETAVRDVYVTGMWDALVLYGDMNYEDRIRTIARWIGRSFGTVRGIVDEYERHKKGLAKAEKNQLELGCDSEGRDG